MKKVLMAAALGAFALFSATATAAAKAPWKADNVPAHPRLFANDARFAEFVELAERDELAKAIKTHILETAEQTLPVPVLERKKTGMRLLTVSREAISRLSRLAFAWRLTKDKRFLDRAKAEMDAICGFSDWNASHYLDTAELCLASAIAYDWLYTALTPAERENYAKKIREKGMECGFPGGVPGKKLWWRTNPNNWNAVCNAGTLAAAWALCDVNGEYARYCETLVNLARESLPLTAGCYAPRGAYPEGPSYWAYGTEFICIALEMLTEMGCEDGIGNAPGLSETVYYISNNMGPSGRSHNYGDNGDKPGASFAHWWLAKRYAKKDALHGFIYNKTMANAKATNSFYRKSDVLKLGSRGDRLFPLIAFYLQEGIKTTDAAKPAVWSTGESDGPSSVISFRTPANHWVSIKAGTPRTNHMHLDAGSFVYDVPGKRFVFDFGGENYTKCEENMKSTWSMSPSSDRWDILRYSVFAHSVPRIENFRAHSYGHAKFFGHETNSFPLSVKADLTTLYKQASKVVRTYTMAEDGTLTVRDEYQGLKPGTAVYSQLPVMPGTYVLDGASGNGKVSVSSPDAQDVKVEKFDDMKKDWETSFKGAERIAFSTKAKDDGSATLTVVVKY